MTFPFINTFLESTVNDPVPANVSVDVLLHTAVAVSVKLLIVKLVAVPANVTVPAVFDIPWITVVPRFIVTV